MKKKATAKKSRDFKQLGARVRSLREEQMLTIRQLHERTGLSIGFISEVENGHWMPGGITLKLLVTALNSTTDYILNGTIGEDPTSFANLSDIPQALFNVAEARNWTIAQVMLLTEVRQSIARRSAYPFTPDDWVKLHAAVVPFLTRDKDDFESLSVLPISDLDSFRDDDSGGFRQ